MTRCEANQQAHRNATANPPVDITLDQLTGSGAHFGIQAQLQFDDRLLTQVRVICSKAWERKNPPAKPRFHLPVLNNEMGDLM